MKKNENDQIKPDLISISQFNGVDLRVGKVLEASIPEGSEKLIKLTVDFRDEQRIVFTGMRVWYNPEYFEGKLFAFVYNLEPKSIMGEESYGMLLAVDTPEGPKPLEAPEGSREGEKIK